MLRKRSTWSRFAWFAVREIREGHFQRSLSLVAGVSSLLSGIEVTSEHYRGSYSQRKMYSPVVLSSLLLGAGIGGAFSRKLAKTVLPLTSALVLADGVIGFYYHVKGVARKPGGWRVPVMNLIMGPPVFAPLLFGISGYLGLLASLLHPEDDPRHSSSTPVASLGASWLEALPLPHVVRQEGIIVAQEVSHGRFQRQMALAAAISAVFSGLEAWYSHYKNNFQYKVQWTPIVITPLIVLAGVAAAIDRRAARTLLPAASLIAMIDGGVGFFYHLRGVLRKPGALHRPIYNIMYGPPMFAPLLFAASGFLGVLASMLRREE